MFVYLSKYLTRMERERERELETTCLEFGCVTSDDRIVIC